MKPGQTQTFDCGDCNREFVVVLEPKAVGMPDKERPKDEVEVANCPFCGSSGVTSEEEAGEATLHKSAPTPFATQDELNAAARKGFYGNDPQAEKAKKPRKSR